MSSLLKELYSPDYIHQLSGVLKSAVPGFRPEPFRKMVFNDQWQQMELKGRMRHIATVMHRFMPDNFHEAAPMVKQITNLLPASPLAKAGLQNMFLPDYVETYGINHPKEATGLMEWITPLASCEFAIRPYIHRYGQDILDLMLAWSGHSDHHVRRLASEGCRPRLPWAMALPHLKKDPGPIMPILENLKTDSSEYVRRSVANNLNDIAKDHPQLVLEIAGKWKGLGAATDALVKHGCRTLLKQGHSGILTHFGLSSKSLKLGQFKVLTPKVSPGGDLRFSFSITNREAQPQTARLEYAMYYLRQNGSHSKKVFKISEREIAGKETLSIHRKQSFRPITTRKYYTGQHRLSVIINGKESEALPFELM